MQITSLELLAPARNAEVARIAILAGADAVYIGGPGFGARSAAGNPVKDIKAVVELAHRYGVRVYVTMNTILYENELELARRQVYELYSAGVDALIVQDMAYLEMDIPPIALHASTQCDVRTPEKAAWLAQAGFSQIVLPREFSLAQIREARQSAGVPVEVFVHGALCVSYSGDCQAGCVAMGRSANRGECPQMCRLKYALTDSQGREIAPPKHYLSLSDMNQIANLEALIEAGASSFKVEGRLKDARYVANVVSAYRLRLDRIISEHPDKYRRASSGTSVRKFSPDLDRTFNRGYTSYFLHKPSKDVRMASVDTPKWRGVPVGRVKEVRKDFFKASLDRSLANGDGLGFFDAKGVFVGFRLNKVEGDKLFPATPLPSLRSGMELYRNSDKLFFDVLDSRDAGCRRTLWVDIVLKEVDSTRLSIEAIDERGNNVVHVFTSQSAPASTPQEDFRRKTFGKLGDTIYTLREYTDCIPERFVAASVLSEAKRQVIDLLAHANRASYAYERRRPDSLAPDAFADALPLTYHDNVANSLAERFYTSHGARIASFALEVSPEPEGEIQVMETKYCIRRELGACLLEKGASRFPRELYLRNESGTYRLDFDCARCGMRVIKLPR